MYTSHEEPFWMPYVQKGGVEGVIWRGDVMSRKGEGAEEDEERVKQRGEQRGKRVMLL
jgi:hypothetical protein